jgi:hypothetical protein
MALLQILHDGERLEQVGPVVELEHGEPSEGIPRQVVRSLLLAFAQVHQDLGGIEAPPNSFSAR